MLRRKGEAPSCVGSFFLELPGGNSRKSDSFLLDLAHEILDECSGALGSGVWGSGLGSSAVECAV